MRYHFGSLLDYSSRSLTRIQNLKVTFFLKLLCLGLMMMALGWHLRMLRSRLNLSAEFYMCAEPSIISSFNPKVIPRETFVL